MFRLLQNSDKDIRREESVESVAFQQNGEKIVHRANWLLWDRRGWFATDGAGDGSDAELNRLQGSRSQFFRLCTQNRNSYTEVRSVPIKSQIDQSIDQSINQPRNRMN